MPMGNDSFNSMMWGSELWIDWRFIDAIGSLSLLFILQLGRRSNVDTYFSRE